MGCFNSSRHRSNTEEYVETLTLKRQVSGKTASGRNLKISISVIADPVSSDDETPTLTYKFQRSRSGAKQRQSFRTFSFAEGRRYTKFPHMCGYKVCNSCKEAGNDVLKTVAPAVEEKEICRKCSVKKRQVQKETGVDTRHETIGQVDMTAFASLLALTALDLTAPASDALLKNRKNTWIQLAGHPGGFAPAGPHTIWKKRYTKDNNETQAYEALMEDTAHDIVPMFYREVEYNSEYFIEIEDLLQHFTDPNIMDVKMGTRTFLESEVKNASLRKDLYDKMVALDPTAPTAEEKQDQAITKLRYMQFREQESSSADFGFRIEALRMSGEPPTTNLKRVKCKEQIQEVLSKFVNNNEVVLHSLIQRLQEIQQRVEESAFFMSHELIGSSLLVMYDKHSKCGIWVIDFSKSNHIGEGGDITHRLPWQQGNHEDGFLMGLDNLIQFLSSIEIKQDVIQKDSPSHTMTGS